MCTPHAVLCTGTSCCTPARRRSAHNVPAWTSSYPTPGLSISCSFLSLSHFLKVNCPMWGSNSQPRDQKAARRPHVLRVCLPGPISYTCACIICVHIWRPQRNVPRTLCTNHPITQGRGAALSPDPDFSPQSPVPRATFSPTDTPPPPHHPGPPY